MENAVANVDAAAAAEGMMEIQVIEVEAIRSSGVIWDA